MEKNIGIIGVGKLGLPYALSFEKAGFNVFASSYKQDYVDQLCNLYVDTQEPNVRQLLEKSKNIKFTVDNHEVIKNCNIIYVMVATPSLSTGDYDVSAVQQVAKDFLSYTGSTVGKKLIIGSTVNPGDTYNIQTMLKDTGVDVVYSPTFVAQGRVIHDIYNMPGILIGTPDQKIGQECIELFRTITSPETPISVVNQTTAEILKLALNCYTTIKIAYFNKIGEMLVASGLEDDIKVADRAMQNLDNSKACISFGFGYGGPCLPRDNKSFQHFANKINVDYSLGETIDRYNREHNNFLYNWFTKQNINNVPFYFPYITYKSGTHITEESRQFELCLKFLENGYTVFIEPDVFLPEEFTDILDRQFSDKVSYVKKTDLLEKEIDFFDVSF